MINFERNTNRIGAINLTFLAGKNSQLGYTNGIAPLSAQILLNGSKKFAKHQLIYKPTQFGGAINIGTSDTFTSINARCLDSNMDKMIEMLFSMIFDSEYNDIEKQKRITREITNNSMNDPFKILLDRLYYTCVDRKFGSLHLGEDFNDITVDEVRAFHNDKYVDPAISIISSDEKNIDLVHSLLDKYNVPVGVKKDEYECNFTTNYDEFSWKISTNNRMLLSFVIDHSPLYDILTTVYQYKINKNIKMDKRLCTRNRCMILPFGITKRLFIIDIEFANYNDKDTIINEVLSIINSGYTKNEFEISKSQLLGNMMYELCDPLKNVVRNSERLIVGQYDINKLIDEIKYCSYTESLEADKSNFHCVIGVRN